MLARHTRAPCRKCEASVESVSQPMHYATEPQFGSTMSLLAQCAFYTMLRLVRPYIYAEIYAAKKNLCDVTKRFFFCPCCIAGCFFVNECVPCCMSLLYVVLWKWLNDWLSLFLHVLYNKVYHVYNQLVGNIKVYFYLNSLFWASRRTPGLAESFKGTGAQKIRWSH